MSRYATYSKGKPSAPPTYTQAAYFAGSPGIHNSTITQGPQAVPLVIQQQDMGQPNTQQPVIIVQQSNMLPLMLNSEPAYILCPACNVRNVTYIERVPTASAPMISCLFCLMGGWCCVCFPYICDSCMNAKHYCSNCNQYLGTFDVNQPRHTN